jgi:hypothetical protein
VSKSWLATIGEAEKNIFVYQGTDEAEEFVALLAEKMNFDHPFSSPTCSGRKPAKKGRALSLRTFPWVLSQEYLS